MGTIRTDQMLLTGVTSHWPSLAPGGVKPRMRPEEGEEEQAPLKRPYPPCAFSNASQRCPTHTAFGYMKGPPGLRLLLWVVGTVVWELGGWLE